jgi:signal transduction histidine kinase
MRENWLHVVPVSDEQGFCGVVTYGDLLERMEQQGRLTRAERDKADRLDVMSLLVAGVAHDFNNILTALFSHLGMLTSQRRDSDQNRETLAGQQLGELLVQLPPFSGDLALEPFQLVSCCYWMRHHPRSSARSWVSN